MLTTKKPDNESAAALGVVEADKIGSAASPLNLPKTVAVVAASPTGACR